MPMAQGAIGHYIYADRWNEATGWMERERAEVERRLRRLLGKELNLPGKPVGMSPGGKGG